MAFLDKFYQLFLNLGPKLPGVIAALVLGYIFIRILIAVLRRVLRIGKAHKALIEIITSLANILLWILLLSEVTRQLGLSSLALTISGSVVALGFAMANGLSALTADIISGLFLSKDQDFEVGYRIKSGDIEGVVEKIDMRKIRIRDDAGKLFILPSSKVDSLGWVVLEKK